MKPIKLGVCAPIDQILLIAQLGYDFIEGNLSETALLSPLAFETQKALVDESPVKAEVFSCLLPRELAVVGRGVNASELHDYLDLAFGRAKALGAAVCVFASAGSRQVTEDFPLDVAWRQMANFLRIAERHAADHGLLLAIEPLCRTECNLLNTLSEATLLLSILRLGHMRIAAGTYHMAGVHESLDVLRQAAPFLAHVHVSNALDRAFPKPLDGEPYADLFRALSEAGYAGRVSIEGFCESFEADANTALSVLRAAAAHAPMQP